jgi:hypothetical protein
MADVAENDTGGDLQVDSKERSSDDDEDDDNDEIGKKSDLPQPSLALSGTPAPVEVLRISGSDTSRREESAKDKFNRRGLIVCSSLFTFFYVGSFFGWGPMQLLLEENGAFHWKCDPADDVEDEVCPSQTSTLLNVQLIASVTQIVSPVLGQGIDHYGAPKSACFASACLGVGLLLLTISSAIRTPAWDSVLFLANSFLALTTWVGGQLTVQTGLYFAGHTKSRVIFLLNALFDGGSITYLFLWWLAQAASLSLTAVAAGYLVFGLFLSLVAMYFWFAAAPEHDDEALVYDGSRKRRSEDATGAGRTSMPKASGARIPVNEHASPVVEHSKDGAPSRFEATQKFSCCELEAATPAPVNSDSISSNAVANEDGRSTIPQEQKPLPSQKSASFLDATSSEGEQDERGAASDTGYVLVVNRPARQQFLSGPYLLLCLFFSLHVTMNMWTLATMRDFLAYLGDDELNNRYLTIFTLLLPASIVSVPLVDVIVLRFGFVGGFQSVNALALGYSIVRIATASLDVQIGTPVLRNGPG